MSVMTFAAWPNKVIAGAGAINTLHLEIKALGCSKVFFVTDNGIKDFPFIKNVKDNLAANGLEVCHYSDIQPSPLDKNVMDGVDLIAKEQCHIIVAIGGGSAIDTARAINVIHTCGGKVRDYHVAEPTRQIDPKKLLPFVASPTTAGTGSEISTGACILDSQTKEELIIDDMCLVPDISVLDGELTLSLPPSVTAATGMDALTHMVESYVSNIDMPISDALAIQGIKMIVKYLPIAVADGSNIEARQQMLWSAFMGSFAFNQSQLGLCHSLALALSALSHIPHGIGNAIMLPKVMRYNSVLRGDKFIEIAKALGVDAAQLTLSNAGEIAASEVEKLMQNIGMPLYLEDINVSKDDLPRLAELALECPLNYDNPRKVTKQAVESILQQSFRN